MGHTGQSRRRPAAADAHSNTAAAEATFQKILVPVDFSEPSLFAIDCAVSLAARFAARVVLLHVVEPVLSADPSRRALPDSTQALLEQGRERLDLLASQRIPNHCPVEILVRIGHAHSEITDTASALGVSLVVLATHNYPDSKPITLGSTAEKVSRQAACAVLTLRTQASA